MTARDKEGLQQFQLMSSNSKITLEQFRKWQLLQHEQRLSMASFLKIKEQYLPEAPRCYQLTDCLDDFNEFELATTTTEMPKLEKENVTSSSSMPSASTESISEKDVMVEERAQLNETTKTSKMGTEQFTKANSEETTQGGHEESTSETPLTQDHAIKTVSTTEVTTQVPATSSLAVSSVVLTTTHVVSLIPGKKCLFSLLW